MNSIIEIKNLSKKYNISHQQGGYIALRDVLTNIAKSPFKFAKHKAKKALGMAGQEEFWALKDINLDIKEGEAVGIIGPNGAGKSTLLKILSKITPPTTGEIKLFGKVSSLLEVGTGFHPELTGRENIALNGAILGMSRKEIYSKFDSIIEFAGIEKFIDTPVKRYSSGMYVRLAFSVAAHMEPDILIVDEVLAVGDAEFQKKCLGKMDEVTKQAGRTILFVSHNMPTVQSLCKKCILLEKGKIKMAGETDKVVNEYLRGDIQREASKSFSLIPGKQAQILKVTAKDEQGNISADLDFAKPFFIEVEYELRANIPNAHIILKTHSQLYSKYIFISLSNDNNCKAPTEQGKYLARLKIEPFLNAGEYSFLIAVATNISGYLDKVLNPISIRLNDRGRYSFETIEKGREASIILKAMPWQTEKIN